MDNDHEDYEKPVKNKRKIAGANIGSVFTSAIKKIALVSVIYFVGYMQWSIGWFMAPIVLLVIKDQYQKSKDRKSKVAKASALVNEEDAILAKLDDLPAWVFFPDVERAEWLNKILKQLWPSVNLYVRNFLLNKIQPKIAKKLQKYKLSGFKFEKMILGSIPPRVGGVKVYETSVARNEIVLDMDLFYAGDCNLSFTVSSAVKGGIKDLQVQGMLRVVLKPLLAKMPIIGGMQLYFLNNPSIDFNLVGVIDILDMPGFSDLLRQLITEQIASHMVLPNKFPLKLSKHVDAEFLNVPAPEGILRVHVVEAKNLMKKDIGILGKGKSDPYAVLTVGAETFKTPTIDNTVDPKWDYWCEAMVNAQDAQIVTVHIWDYDPAFPGTQNDDLLGRASIDIHTIAKKGQDDMWVTLEQAKHGLVHLRLTWFSLTSDYSDLRTVLEETQQLQVTAMSSALLTLYVDSARNLPQIRKNKPDPYLLVTVGHTSRRTEVKKRCSDPVWEHGFNFLIPNPDTDSVYLNIIDQKTGSGLGQLTYNLSALSEKPYLSVTLQPFGLLKSGPESKLTFSMHLKILKHTFLVDGLVDPGDEAELSRQNSTSSIGSVKIPLSREPSVVSSIIQDKSIVEEVVEDTNVGLQSSTPVETSIEGLHHRQLTSTSSSGESGLGRIQLTLRYSVQRQRLIIVIHKIANLPPSKDPTNIPDPYVKLYLLPGRAKETKRKTNVIKDNYNPVFDVTFEYVLSQGELHSQQLEVTVATEKRLLSAKSNIMGQVIVDLAKINLTQSGTYWFDLQPEFDD